MSLTLDKKSCGKFLSNNKANRHLDNNDTPNSFKSKFNFVLRFYQRLTPYMPSAIAMKVNNRKHRWVQTYLATFLRRKKRIDQVSFDENLQHSGKVAVQIFLTKKKG